MCIFSFWSEGLAMRSCVGKSLTGMALVISGFLLAQPNLAGAADWSATVGGEFTSGKFGADQATQIVIATADVAASFNAWQVRATLPYVRVDGPSTFLGPIDVGDLTGEATQRDRFGLGVLDDGNVSGVGDLRVSASRYFYVPKVGVLIDLSAALKVPTGDPDKLLGTGQVDMEIGAEFVKRVGNTSASLGAGYAFSGRTDRFDVQNRARLSLSVYHELSERYGVGLVGEWRQAVIADLPDVAETTVYFSARVSENISLIAYTLTGFSNTSPDIGGGLRLTRGF